MIIIGKGVQHFKKEQKLKWREIKERLGNKSLAHTQNLGQKTSGHTALITKLAAAFGVSEVEFVIACIKEEE